MFKWTYILYTVYYCQTINNMYSKKLYSNVNLCIFIVDKVKTQKKKIKHYIQRTKNMCPIILYIDKF